MKTEECLESLICPVCRSKIQSEIARCGRCGLAHHEECAGICARYGCGGKAGEEVKVPEPIPALPVVQAPLPAPMVEAPARVNVGRWERRLGYGFAWTITAILCGLVLYISSPEGRGFFGGVMVSALMAGVAGWALTKIPTEYD